MTVQSNQGLYNSGTYIPFLCDITGITSSAQQSVVTTAVTHGFVVGNQVQFLVPQQWGMVQMNGLKGLVLSITSNTLTVNIDSSQFNPFITPSVTLPVVIDTPQVIPIGGQNTGYVTPNILQPVLQIPGTFRNTYP
jgi:hypothetical protein